MSEDVTTAPAQPRSTGSAAAGAAPAVELASVRRARRRTRLVVLLCVVLLALLAASAGWVALETSTLGVRTVEVTGVQRLSAEEVRDAAAIPAGTPLARLDSGAVADRVARLAPVRRVEVNRDWPRTVRITVVERTPAAVQARGSAWVLVDRGGVAFDTVQKRPRGLPRISAPVDEGPPALRATLDVLEALPVAVREQVREVRAAGPDRVTLQLTRHRTVEWGSTERSARKAAVLAVLLSRKAKVYDVTAPDSPTPRRH